jgi:hypothetical protein
MAVISDEGPTGTRARQPGRDADVDDRLAGAVEGAVHERAERLAVPVARASAPSSRSKAAPNATSRPATSHEPAWRRSRPPRRRCRSRSASARWASGRRGRRRGRSARRRRGAVAQGGGHEAAHAASWPAPAAPPRARGSGRARRGAGADDLAAVAPGLDQPGQLEPAQVPRNERLRQVDVAVSSVTVPARRPGAGGGAGGWCRPAPCGTAHLAQVVGRGGDRGDGRTDSCRGGHRDWAYLAGAPIHQRRYI